jgi:predicted dehydrogenase
VSDNLRVGVVGAGYWGPNIIRNMWELPEVDLVGVADKSPEAILRVKTRYRDLLTTVTDYRELFELGVDAVSICTPPETHYRIASDALDAGLHVLVEKPLTTSSETAAALIVQAEEAGLTLMVGHTFEYNPAVLELRRLIASGALGEILYIDAVRVGLGLFHPTLNVVWDLAPHDISILNFLTDATPIEVAAHGAACLKPDLLDVAYLNLVFPDGVTANTRMSWLDPAKARRTTVVGSEKMVVYDDVEPLEKLRIYDKKVTTIRRTETFGDFSFSYHYGSVVSPHIHFEEPLKAECREFVDAVLTSRTPRTDGHCGLRVVQVIEAAQESLASGGLGTKVSEGSAASIVGSSHQSVAS